MIRINFFILFFVRTTIMIKMRLSRLIRMISKTWRRTTSLSWRIWSPVVEPPSSRPWRRWRSWWVMTVTSWYWTLFILRVARAQLSALSINSHLLDQENHYFLEKWKGKNLAEIPFYLVRPQIDERLIQLSLGLTAPSRTGEPGVSQRDSGDNKQNISPPTASGDNSTASKVNIIPSRSSGGQVRGYRIQR